MNRLAGKVAVVTGAAQGIGAGIASGLAAEGAAVVVNYATNKAGADRVVSAITSKGGKAVSIQGDVSKAADVQRIVAEATKSFGRLDVLVNNAGAYKFAPFEEFSEEEFHRQFNTNVLGTFLTIRAAIDYFGPEGGSIINIGSTASKRFPPTLSTYVATKCAIDGITGVLSKELGPRKIRVNSINPGVTETEGLRSVGGLEDEIVKRVAAETPLGRIGDPEDVARIAVFLASSESGWLTGEVLLACGGRR